MERKDIIIDALTAQIETMREDSDYKIADLETALEYSSDAIKKMKLESDRDSNALSLLQSFLMEKHKDLIPELADYIVKEVDEAYDQDERYNYGLRALHDMSEVLGCDGGSPIIDELDKSVARLQLLNKKPSSTPLIEADTDWIDSINGNKVTVKTIDSVTLTYDLHEGEERHRHITQISSFKERFKPCES